MRTLLPFVLLAPFAACSDESGHGNENEVITTVALTFTPSGGGNAIVAESNDPDGDGGDPPTSDPINLTAGMYSLAVAFENRLESPPEDITMEVRDESHEHQVFFTGTAIDGALTHTYADTDANGLPIGLASTVTARTGTGELVVTLRHMPPINDVATKTACAAMQVKTNGFTAIGGTSDAQVTFTVTVP